MIGLPPLETERRKNEKSVVQFAHSPFPKRKVKLRVLEAASQNRQSRGGDLALLSLLGSRSLHSETLGKFLSEEFRSEEIPCTMSSCVDTCSVQKRTEEITHHGEIGSSAFAASDSGRHGDRSTQICPVNIWTKRLATDGTAGFTLKPNDERLSESRLLGQRFAQVPDRGPAPCGV